MKDSPRTPLEKTGDWIEYVLRHGGARHLRAEVFNIPWYQYYLLDVIAFLVALVTLVVMVIRLTCRCMCRVAVIGVATKLRRSEVVLVQYIFSGNVELIRLFFYRFTYLCHLSRCCLQVA